MNIKPKSKKKNRPLQNLLQLQSLET